MDFTDASPFDTEVSHAAIRHGIISSILLGLLGFGVAAGGYAMDCAVGESATAPPITIQQT